jgi:hypothetical protein
MFPFIDLANNKMANGAFWWLIRGNWSTVKEIDTRNHNLT